MKNIKNAAFIVVASVAFLFASSVARADSWVDFTTSMNNSSFQQGGGFTTNYGSFYAGGGASDQNGFSAFSATGELGGMTVGNYDQSKRVRNQGSTDENISLDVSVNHSPVLASATTQSSASVWTTSSGNTTSAGYAGISANVVSVTQRGM